MSRVAKNPVALPAGVDVSIDASQIVVKGPLGTMIQALHPSVKVERGEAGVQCSAIEGATNSKAMSGTMRALVNNKGRRTCNLRSSSGKSNTASARQTTRVRVAWC